MAFGSPFAQKPRRPEPVRPLTGALVRIVVLALLATLGAAWGIYVYYTHAFRAKSRPIAAPSETWVEIDLNAMGHDEMPSASASASATPPR